MTVPTTVGSTTAYVGGVGTMSLSRATANAVTGDVVLIASTSITVGTTIFDCTNATFVTISPAAVMGTRTCQVIARYVEAGDPASYICGTGATSTGKVGLMITVRGSGITSQAELSKIIKGPLGLRNVTGTVLTNVANGVVTPENDSLVLTASFEATTANETVTPVFSGGATLVTWSTTVLGATQVETVLWGSKSQLLPSLTSADTITYQNNQSATNGAAVQIAIPPPAFIPNTPALLTQFGTDPAMASGTTEVITVPSTLPVGTLVVVGFVGIAALNPTFTIADSVTPDNTWVMSTAQLAGFTTNIVLFSSVLTTALPAGSTLTITSSQSMSRRCSAVAAFNNPCTGSITHGAFNETSATIISGGSHTPAADSLVFGVLGFNSAGRVFTPDPGWTAYTKHLSTVGSGERSVQLVARSGVAATPFARVGLIDSSGVMLCGLGSAVLGAPPSTGWIPGVMKYWDGTAWITPSPTAIKYWDGTAWQQVPAIKVWQP